MVGNRLVRTTFNRFQTNPIQIEKITVVRYIQVSPILKLYGFI